MINTKMHLYDYYTMSGIDAYGQAAISKEVKGSVKMAVYTTTQNVQNNILYLNAQYMALTHDRNINDTYVIQYGDTKLKVLYINDTGRYKQVFLSKVE